MYFFVLNPNFISNRIYIYLSKSSYPERGNLLQYVNFYSKQVPHGAPLGIVSVNRTVDPTQRTLPEERG